MRLVYLRARWTLPFWCRSPESWIWDRLYGLCANQLRSRWMRAGRPADQNCFILSSRFAIEEQVYNKLNGRSDEGSSYDTIQGILPDASGCRTISSRGSMWQCHSCHHLNTVALTPVRCAGCPHHRCGYCKPVWRHHRYLTIIVWGRSLIMDAAGLLIKYMELHWCECVWVREERLKNWKRNDKLQKATFRMVSRCLAFKGEIDESL